MYLVFQHMAVSGSLPITHKCCIQAIVAAYLNLMSQITAIPEFCQHVAEVSLLYLFIYCALGWLYIIVLKCSLAHCVLFEY